MASSSSNPSSTSSSSSTTSTTSAARVLPTRATVPAARAGLFGVAAPGANASASATALGVATGAIASAAGHNPAPVISEIDFPPLGTPAPRKRRGWSQNSASVSRFASVMSSTEESSSSAAPAWSAPSPSSTTVASTPTDTRPASTASSSTTPFTSSASAVETTTIAHTAPEPNAPTSSAPVVPKISDLALQPGALTSASAPKIVHTAPGLDASTSSAPGVTNIADLALQPGVFPLARPAPLSRPASNRSSASTPSSALGVTTSTPGAAPTASATASGPGAAPTIFPGLRDNWADDPWGMPPRSPMVRFPGLEALGGYGTSSVEALYPDPVWACRREELEQPSVLFCVDCGVQPARIGATPCGHLAICYDCYRRRGLCPCCGVPVVIWVYHR